MQLIFVRLGHNLSQLHNEILDAFPSLKGIIRVEGRESDGLIRLTLPNGVLDPGLTAMVNTHDPSKPDKGQVAANKAKADKKDAIDAIKVAVNDLTLPLTVRNAFDAVVELLKG